MSQGIEARLRARGGLLTEVYADDVVEVFDKIRSDTIRELIDDIDRSFPAAAAWLRKRYAETDESPAQKIARLRYRTRPDGMIERVNDPDGRAPYRDNQDILGGCGNGG